MLRYNFYFGMRGGLIVPRVIAVKVADYPRRAFSMSRWLEIRATIESAT